MCKRFQCSRREVCGHPREERYFVRVCACCGGVHLKGVRHGRFKQCSGCMQVHYCSVRCQELDWAEHSRWCTQKNKSKSAAAVFAQGGGVVNLTHLFVADNMEESARAAAEAAYYIPHATGPPHLRPHPAPAPATGGAGAEPGAKPATGGAAFAAKHGGTAAPTIAFLESDLGMPRATHAEGHHVFPEGMPEGQTTMMDIEALLPENIIFMERSRQMHERILNEPRLRIWLPRALHIHQHIVKVVRALLSWRSSLLFKVGIAVDVHHRFHTAHYAYMKPLSHLRDGVRYEGMHVVYIHKTRSTIAMAEHMAINNLLDCKEFQSKIANKKTDLDTHIPGDESDDDRYDAVGPHYLYIAWGEPGPCNRK